MLRTSHGIKYVGYGLFPLPQHLLQPLDGQPVLGKIVFHDFAVHNQLDRERLDGRDVQLQIFARHPLILAFFLDGQLPVILQARVLDLLHIENIFFTQRLGQRVQCVADFSHVVLENFAVLDHDGRSTGYYPVPCPVFERDLGHEERDAEEHQKRYDDEPMVELIVKRQIRRNGAQRDAAHEVMEGHIGYRLLA